MITQKKVLLSGAVLVLFFIAIWLSSALDASKRAKAHAPLYPSITMDQIESFSLQQNGNGVHLTKDSLGSWHVAPLGALSHTFRADSAKVVAILDKIEIMKSVRVVTTDRSDLAQFELDKTQGVKVKVYGESDIVLANFTVGKKAQNWRNTYVIKEGVSDIVEASGSISYVFKTGLSNWRDNSIPFIDPASVVQVVVTGDTLDSDIVLDNTGENWSITYNSATTIKENNLVNRFLGSFNPFMVADWDYANTADSITGLSKPLLSIEVRHITGESAVLNIGNKHETLPRYYINASTIPQQAFIYNAKVEGLLYALENLK